MGSITTCTVEILQRQNEADDGLYVGIHTHETGQLDEKHHCSDWTLQGNRNVTTAEPTMTFRDKCGQSCTTLALAYCEAEGTFNSDECELEVSGSPIELCASRFVSFNCTPETSAFRIWVVAIIIIAIVVLLAALTVWIIFRRRKSQNRKENAEECPASAATTSSQVGQETKVNALYGTHNDAYEPAQDESSQQHDVTGDDLATTDGSSNAYYTAADQTPATQVTKQAHNYEIVAGSSLEKFSTATAGVDSGQENPYHVIKSPQDESNESDHDRLQLDEQTRDTGEPVKKSVDNVLYNL